MGHRAVTRRRALALASAMAATLMPAGSGCGPFGPSAPAARDEAAQLRLLHNWSPTQVHSQAMADLVRDYTASQPQVQIEMEYAPGGDPYVEKLRTLLAAGTPPHVATLLQDYLSSFAKPLMLVPVEKLLSSRDLAKADIFEGPRTAATFDGVMVALPYIATNVGVHFNQSAFEQEGQTPPRDAWTWDDLIATARRLTRVDAAGAGRYGVSFPWGGGVTTTQHWLPFLWQANGEVFDPNGKKALFQGQPGLDALQLWADLLQKHRASPPPGTGSNFVLGEVAMSTVWAGGISTNLRDIRTFTWGTVPLPRRQRNATTLSGHALCVLKDTPTQGASARFVRWFTAAPQLARFNSATTTLPPRKSAQNEARWQEFVRATPQIKAFADAMPVARPTPPHPRWSEMSVAIGTAVAKAMRQEVSPRAALEDAARQVDVLAQQAG